MEVETLTLQADLQSARDEIKCLEADLKKVNERLVELWQENCKQLLGFDSAMAGKDKELQSC